MIEETFKIIELPNFKDDRGEFFKLFHKNNDLKNFTIEQINFVKNPNKGILRGLHYQTGDYAESKLFRVLEGEIILLLFCVDSSSVNYLKSFQLALSTHKSVLVPKGYATGYLVLSDNTNILYLSDQPYKPESENGIRIHDKILNFELPEIKFFISEKDKLWTNFGNS